MMKPNLHTLAIAQLSYLVMALPLTRGGPGLHRSFAQPRNWNKP